MAIFDVTDSAGLRAAIQQAGATDTINLVGPGPYSVGTLAKVKSFTPAPTGAAGYTINGNGFSVTNTRIYQENLEGPGPGTLSNVTLSYTSAAANNTAILRATSGNYLLDGVTITGQHGGWAGNGNLYMSLAVSTAANPVNATLTIQSSTVNVTGQGNGFNGTSGGSAFLHSFNNIGTVQLLNNSFDEAGFLSSFNFFTSPGSAPLGTYAITNNTFFRSANQNARTRGNRLENVSVTLSGNTFQNGSFIDLLGSISGVSFGANTFDTVAGGFGIRLTNPNSGTPLTGDLPDITGSITFNGPGLPLKLLSSTPLSKSLKANLASVNTITITGLGTFDSLTAGGQAAYNNNTFSYVWNAAVPATVNITIPDGNYSIADLNLYLQSVMIANTHYLIDPAGNFLYYLQLTENIVTYKVDFISSPIPNALGTLVFPSGATWALPAVAQTPQIIVPNTDFQRLIGFTPATYPAAIQATVYSVSSTSTPQITDITSIVMTCNMINNPFALPPNTIYTFAITGAFLEFLNPPINELVFNTTVPGLYPYLEISFLDNLYRDLEIRDTNLTITCVLRTVSES